MMIMKAKNIKGNCKLISQQVEKEVVVSLVIGKPISSVRNILGILVVPSSIHYKFHIEGRFPCLYYLRQNLNPKQTAGGGGAESAHRLVLLSAMLKR